MQIGETLVVGAINGKDDWIRDNVCERERERCCVFLERECIIFVLFNLFIFY